MVCCLAVGCVIGDLKVQVFKASPSVIVLFCHFPSHPATSLPHAVCDCEVGLIEGEHCLYELIFRTFISGKVVVLMEDFDIDMEELVE